ncbi:MAG: DUF58 domain-containing protein [Thermoplasmatota archaeon]
MTLRWTPAGMAVGVGGLAATAAGAWLGAPLLVLLAAAALAGLTLDAAAILRSRPHASFAVSPQRIPEGQASTVTVTTARLRPSQQVRIPLAGPLRLAKGSNLLGSGAAEATFEVTCEARGPHAIGPVLVRTWGPLRLWAAEESLGEEQVLEVVPREDDASGVSLRSRVVTPVQGRFQVNRPGQGFDFFTLREYRSGDTMRSINWKATARRDGEFIVNQRQVETHGEVTILLDARAPTGLGLAGQTPLDRGCRIALGIFSEALSHRDTVHFIAYGSELHELPATRQDRIIRLQKMLAFLEAGGNTPLAQAWSRILRDVRSSSGPVLIVTTAEADPTLVETVRSMVGRGHAVTVISPTPGDAILGEREQARRRQAREATLTGLRDAGAAVKDWEQGHVTIEAPMRRIGL